MIISKIWMNFNFVLVRCVRLCVLYHIDDCCVILLLDTYVMQSTEISLKSNMWYFQFFIWLEWYILLKTPPESDQWFISYKQLKDSQNNRTQKKLISFSDYFLQSMLTISDWSR